MTETIDERTGEIIPEGINQETDEPKRDIVVMNLDASKVGTLELDEMALKALDEPLDPGDVKIRPDGLLYLPWTWFAKRLNDAVGRLKWGLVPQGSPKGRATGNNTELIVWGFWLMIKGIPVSFAYGETSYRTNNNTMSYADAVAGAKSIALARCCKELGMALQLWDPQWIDGWKKEFAVHIPNPTGNRPEKIWVRKDDKRYNVKAKPASKPVASEEPDVNKDYPQGAEFKAPETDSVDGYTKAQILANKDNQVQSLKDLTGKSSAEVCQFVGKLEERKKYPLFAIADMMNPKEKSDETVS